MKLEELLLYSFNKNNFVIPRNTREIDITKLIEFVASELSCRRGALGYSSQGWNNFINKVFPDKRYSQYKNCSYKTYLLSLVEYKQCPVCEEILQFEFFHKNYGKTNDLASNCKECEREIQRKIAPARQARRRASLLHRTPKWADLEKIREIYKQCPKGMVVDHIIPLQGHLVSGLHIAENLQYLTQSENSIKSNKFTV